MKLELKRSYQGADATVGQIVLPSGERLATLERPWVPKDKAPCGTKGVSCIPKGVYQLRRHSTESHPRTWALVCPPLWVYHWDEDVPIGQVGIARTLVLIHIANYVSELRGCIAVGLNAGREGNGRWKVSPSRNAMMELQATVPWTDDHSLEIS
jgi:hypothetical protein